MRRKKRQTVTLLVLCLVLIAAGVGYYALIRHQAAQEKAQKAEESAKELFQLSSDDINKVEYQGEKSSLTFEKDGKTWKLSSDKNYPLNQDKIVDMVDETTGVAATKTVTTSSDELTQYDLDKPDLTETHRHTFGGWYVGYM